jgi:A/G-specific adenine glycosylase
LFLFWQFQFAVDSRPVNSRWFSERLRHWYLASKRNLPWRETTDPYRIWVSEIILQQTRVNQGLAYYQRFIEEFPDLKSLAKAKEDKVMKMWQGLGYYSRARNMHMAAKLLVSEHAGSFPRDFGSVSSLPGIGSYTASAICSFAFGLPYAVVDGNVYRVLSRVFGIVDPINSAEGKRRFAELAGQLLSKSDPATHNQAIMEFGAIQCTPRNPDCKSCIFSGRCAGFANSTVESLPVKAEKKEVKVRYLNYFVVIDRKNRIGIKKRNGKDIWKGLYEFLLVETKRSVPANKMAGLFPRRVSSARVSVSAVNTHMLSHQRLNIRFCRMNVRTLPSGLKATSVDKLGSLAFPRPLARYIEETGKQLE